MISPRPYISKPELSPAVASRLQDLSAEGAVLLEPSFSVASPTQVEIVYNDHRYLLTDRNEVYNRYAEVMARAKLPYASGNSEYGNEAVVVSEVSRSARVLPQIMRGAQSRGGQTIREVFNVVGRSLSQIELSTGLAPAVGSLALQKILLLREEGDIMFAPPIEFEPVIDNTNANLVEAMGRQLFPDYAKFGAAAMLEAFSQGLNDDFNS